MESWWSFALGVLSGVALALLTGGVAALAWLVRNGRDEWRKLYEIVKIRRDLQDETFRLGEDIEELERKRAELRRTTPPRIPSITEVKRDIGISR